MIRALVIDDDPDVRALTAIALRVDRGFAVEAKATARGALNRLDTDCARYDVILVGTTTPDMDGALIAAIRQRPDCIDTPIVFLAQRMADADRQRYETMGVAGIFALPFDPVTFVRDVADLVAAVPH